MGGGLSCPSQVSALHRAYFCVHVWRQEEVLNVDGVQFIGQCQNACQWQEMPKLWDKGLRQKVCFFGINQFEMI